ncbi:MAG: citrate/2-methylcitrate synthase [Pseudomonadota bacterium]|nr:citrate/2-methylcitrate synthase [Pseudomonadota bacterium]
MRLYSSDYRIQPYKRGLENLVVNDTRVSFIDGINSKLLYRGYPLEDLADNLTFEDVAWLILHGEIPTPTQSLQWAKELREWRHPPQEAYDVLKYIPANAHPLAQYRTMITIAACHIPEAERYDLEAQWRRPGRILSWSACLAAAAIRHLDGEKPLPPRDDLGYSANFLWQALGREASPEEVKAFDVSLIVQAEHGLHAAAFAALIVISTGADLGSAVLAGMGALSGIRHGGANQTAYEDLLALASVDQARVWVENKLAEKYRFPGYGHRVYKCPDPRVRVLEPYAKAMLEKCGMQERWEIYATVRHEVEARLGVKGLYANVDSITGLVYAPIGLPVTAFPIPFCLAIETGWMAHCLEYLPRGAMIEPGAVYVTEE